MLQATARETLLISLQNILTFSHTFFCLSASSINTCSRNLPSPEKCILDEINNLRPNLATGNLGDGVRTVPLEPLALENIHFKRGPDFQATFNNILVNGPSSFDVKKMKYVLITILSPDSCHDYK